MWRLVPEIFYGPVILAGKVYRIFCQWYRTFSWQRILWREGSMEEWSERKLEDARFNNFKDKCDINGRCDENFIENMKRVTGKLATRMQSIKITRVTLGSCTVIAAQITIVMIVRAWYSYIENYYYYYYFSFALNRVK